MPSDDPTELLGSERPKGEIIVHVLRWLPADLSTSRGGCALGPEQSRSGLIQVLWSQFSNIGQQWQQQRGVFCHQNSGKVAEPSIPFSASRGNNWCIIQECCVHDQ